MFPTDLRRHPPGVSRVSDANACAAAPADDAGQDADVEQDGGTDADPTHGTDYDWMLDTLDGAIAEAAHKIENGRVYDAENEKVRIKWIRALAYTMDVRRSVANDAERAELAERVEALEADAETDTLGGLR